MRNPFPRMAWQWLSTGRNATVLHGIAIWIWHAPLLFDMPCRDTACKDGGHDVTNAITRSLKAGETQFEGEHQCTGYVGDGPCQRVLRYTATATYK